MRRKTAVLTEKYEAVLSTIDDMDEIDNDTTKMMVQEKLRNIDLFASLYNSSKGDSIAIGEDYSSLMFCVG